MSNRLRYYDSEVSSPILVGAGAALFAVEFQSQVWQVFPDQEVRISHALAIATVNETLGIGHLTVQNFNVRVQLQESGGSIFPNWAMLVQQEVPPQAVGEDVGLTISRSAHPIARFTPSNFRSFGPQPIAMLFIASAEVTNDDAVNNYHVDIQFTVHFSLSQRLLGPA